MKLARLLVAWLVGLLGEKHSLDVGEYTALSNGDTGEKLVQLFVIADSQLKMTWDDSRLLVIAGSVACQLENLGGQIFHDGGQVHGCTGSDALGVVALAEQTVDTTDGELQSSAG